MVTGIFRCETRKIAVGSAEPSSSSSVSARDDKSAERVWSPSAKCGRREKSGIYAGLNGAQGRQIFAPKNDAKSLIYKAYNFLKLPVNRKSVYRYV